MKTFTLLFFPLLLIPFKVFTQRVAINSTGNPADPSAIAGIPGPGDITAAAMHVIAPAPQNNYLELNSTNVSGICFVMIMEMNLFAMGINMGMY